MSLEEPVIRARRRRLVGFGERPEPEPGWSPADQLLWTISLAVVFVLGFAGGVRVASHSRGPADAACAAAAPGTAVAAPGRGAPAHSAVTSGH